MAGALGTGVVSFNGGILGLTGTADYSSQFSQAANQAYNINNTSIVTFATAMKSVGGTFTKSGSSVLTSTANNTFTGGTTLNAGTMILSGASGALSASSTITLKGGGLTLTNTGAGNSAVNRLSDTANVVLAGGTLALGGSDQSGTGVSETIGTLTAGAGGSGTPVVTVTAGIGGSTRLTAGSYSRTAGSLAVLANGVGLGSTATSNSQLQLTVAPALVGTTDPLTAGINANAKNTSIAPGLVGEATANSGGTGTATGNANTFLTYTAAGGLRPLNPIDEFTANAITAGSNTRLTTATSMTASTVINSLVFGGSSAGNTLALSTGTTLTNTSGMILFAPTANVASTITGGTVAFGASEGLIYAGSVASVAQVITSAVTGSNGLTVAGPGIVTINGNLTLSGGTLTNAQHFLHLGGANNLAGAAVVSSAGGGGILYIDNAAALDGASGVTLTNGSQLRYTVGTATIGAPATYGDGVTSGNLYVQGPSNVTDLTLSGLQTLNSPAVTVFQSYNNNGNSLAFTGGITSTAQGTGGVQFQSAGTAATTSYHRFSLSGTLNYAGPTILEGVSNQRLAMVNTTLPATTVLQFQADNVQTYQFDLNGTKQTVAGLQSTAIVGVGQVINSSTASAGSLTVNNAASYVFAGNLGTVGAINAGGTAPNATGSTATIILGEGTSNNFSLTKGGAGTLTLTGAGSYTGGTTINAGRLLVANATALGTGGVGYGASGGTLATPAGALSMANLITTANTASTIAPGASVNSNVGVVGALTLTAGLNLANGATIPFDLASTTALSDHLTVTGGTLTGATGPGSGSIVCAFNDLGLTMGATYTLITYSGATPGDLDVGDFSATGVGGSFRLAGTELDFIPAVPEPSTWLGGLLLLAFAGLGLRRRGRDGRLASK